MPSPLRKHDQPAKWEQDEAGKYKMISPRKVASYVRHQGLRERKRRMLKLVQDKWKERLNRATA